MIYNAAFAFSRQTCASGFCLKTRNNKFQCQFVKLWWFVRSDEGLTLPWLRQRICCGPVLCHSAPVKCWWYCRRGSAVASAMESVYTSSKPLCCCRASVGISVWDFAPAAQRRSMKSSIKCLKLHAQWNVYVE